MPMPWSAKPATFSDLHPYKSQITIKMADKADQQKEGPSMGERLMGSKFVKFFTSEAPVAKPEDKAPKKEAAPVAPAPVADTPIQSKIGVSNKGIKAKLWEEIGKQNQPGMDFYEFNKALEGNKDVRVVDKYKKVFDIMKAMGDTDDATLKATLLSSGEFYLTVLDNEKSGFETDYQAEVESRVGVKRKEAEQIAKEVEDLERQRAEIEQQIQDKQTRAGQLQDEISTEEIALERQSNDFKASWDEVRQEIKSKLDNIKQHIVPDQAQKEEATK